MFSNLRVALYRKGITVKQYAEILGVGEKTVQNKLAGKTDFTYSEFKRTCALFFEYNADYLFATEGELPSEADCQVAGAWYKQKSKLIFMAGMEAEHIIDEKSGEEKLCGN